MKVIELVLTHTGTANRSTLAIYASEDGQEQLSLHVSNFAEGETLPQKVSVTIKEAK